MTTLVNAHRPGGTLDQLFLRRVREIRLRLTNDVLSYFIMICINRQYKYAFLMWLFDRVDNNILGNFISTVDRNIIFYLLFAYFTENHAVMTMFIVLSICQNCYSVVEGWFRTFDIIGCPHAESSPCLNDHAAGFSILVLLSQLVMISAHAWWFIDYEQFDSDVRSDVNESASSEYITQVYFALALDLLLIEVIGLLKVCHEIIHWDRPSTCLWEERLRAIWQFIGYTLLWRLLIDSNTFVYYKKFFVQIPRDPLVMSSIVGQLTSVARPFIEDLCH